MAKLPRVFGLNELELTNNDLFVRKNVDNFDVDYEVIVEDTHNAILIKDGRMMETLEGGSYPLFDKKSGLFKDKKIGSSRVELIYMSKTTRLLVKWGTPNPFDFRDDYTGLPIKIGAFGEFEVRIKDPRKFYLELMGANRNFTLDDLRDRLRGRLLDEITPAISKTMREEKISYDAINEYKKQISQKILPELKAMFADDYGLDMCSLTILQVSIDQKYTDAIEAKREEMKSKEEIKKTAKEIAEEIERLNDKAWERELVLKELEKSDYEKYLEVCKIIGWNGKNNSKGQGGAKFCSNCGHSYENGAKFCPGCGQKVGAQANICPKCNKENPEGARFCSECGAKLQ